MDLSKFNEAILLNKMANWDIPKDFIDPIYNYLVYGYQPGSFFTALLANDCWTAMTSCHPNNTTMAIKNLVGFIRETIPDEACGSYDNVDNWLGMSDLERRKVLENNEVILTEAAEIMAILSGEKVPMKPMFF